MRFLTLAPLLLLCACSETDYCAEAPLCEDGRAINCEPSCTVGPCSTGPHFQTCAESEACTIVPGDLTSSRYFRSRALCVQGAEACDPATAGPPSCDGQGSVTGCSGYKRVIHTSCSQAGLYFESAPCCRGAPNPSTPDAGTPDGGVPDGGTSGTDGGR
ncbi:hypothetical protein P2318_26005 [Myxococcaceae bacterium GXIMD 01537]